jgi:hypothetical protein
MSAINFAKMIAEHPLPAFASPGEVAELTIYGQTCTVYSALMVKPVQVFDNFSNFPKEIQTKIWGFADIGRIITAVEKRKRKANGFVVRVSFFLEPSSSFSLPRLPLLILPGRFHADSKILNSGNVALATTSDEDSDEKDDDDAGNSDEEDKEEKEDFDVSNAFKFIGAGYPIIFQVSKQVQELAAAMGYQPMFQVHGSRKVVYFNPKVDTLRLLTATVRDNLQNQIPLSKALVKSSELKMVLRLHVELPAFMVHHKSVVKDIRSMVCLQELTLFGTCDVRPSSPQFTLKLRFEYDGEKAVSIADIPGNRLTGDLLVSLLWSMH